MGESPDGLAHARLTIIGRAPSGASGERELGEAR
jgi:hypothetical protein